MAKTLESLLARVLTAIAAAVFACLAPSIASAQEAPAALEFSFSNPGARSLGLAGGFVALADDATAAFANPAGLVQLSRAEISAEFRRREYSTPYTEGGRAQGDPTGWGIDTVDGVRTSRSNETTSGLSFLSFVYPGDRWSVAVFHHQLADFSVSTEVNGLFADVTGIGWERYEDQLSTTDLEIVGTGLAGAFRVNDRLSLGLGVTYFSGDVVNRGAGYWVTQETFWDWNSFPDHMKWLSSDFTIDDSDVGFNLGILWKLAENWRLGGVYRQGPRFDYALFNRAGALHPEPEGTIVASVTDHSISFPDVWGLGIAFRSPDGSLTVGFEWDRVEYSVIGETLDSPLADTSLVAIDDADELRLGVEYVFLKSSPLIAIRGGVWRDPDHRFRYTGEDVFQQALYQQGEDLLHVTAGVGIAFKNFQLDLGADLSQNRDIFALSAIYSF